MSPMPIPESFAEEFYAGLAPVAYQDEVLNWPLLKYCMAIGVMFQVVEDYARDTANGDPGWSVIMDVNRCPPEALDWLGQLKGVRPVPGLTTDQKRARIAGAAGFNRGTPQAMRDEARATLAGAGTVILRERYDVSNPTVDSPGYFQVVTFTAETPNPSLTYAALLSQKPAGLLMTHTVVTGQDYQLLKNNNPTYQDVKNTYATYLGVQQASPGI